MLLLLPELIRISAGHVVETPLVMVVVGDSNDVDSLSCGLDMIPCWCELAKVTGWWCWWVLLPKEDIADEDVERR